MEQLVSKATLRRADLMKVDGEVVVGSKRGGEVRFVLKI
jgi:hypothetical protein